VLSIKAQAILMMLPTTNVLNPNFKNTTRHDHS
jgi:hypothetical protein